MGDMGSKLTQGISARPSGDFGSRFPASSFGLTHTTVRMDPTREATMELSRSEPMRTAMST